MAKKRKGAPRTVKIERQYERQLRRIARHVGDIIRAFPPGDPAAEPVIRRALEGYAGTLDGWARHVARQMLESVSRVDEQAWRERAVEMSARLRDELRGTPIAGLMRDRLDEQVTLIKSIPLDAAQRVHRLTLAGQENATRAPQIAAAILESDKIAASRATLIARTEVARTASLLTEARAKHVGSEGYIWRTSGDSDVRDSHDEMEGVYVRWDTPPTLDNMVGHAGQFPNCRCYPEPVIPEP
ncbi:MAG TPA: phage minor head protein [Acidimicrobiales bacterium]|nr:phage minor head protein [Acidimicrobiales bacterium]